jgi:sialate O-acetylesterase
VVKSDSSFIACNWDTARQEPAAGNCPSIGGFEVAGDDRKFYPASAYILGNRVIVFSKEVASPVAVRFAWADDAKAANLFNREGFPAVPFRTDQWKGITDDKKFSVR